MDSKNFAIGVLSITATILFVGLILINILPQATQAAEISGSGGDFTISVGAVTQDTDLLYIIDNVSQRIGVYGFNRKTGAVGLTDWAELSKLGGR